MRLSVCLLDLQGLPDEREQLNTLALSLPFGQAERDRLMAKNNLLAFKQSLGGLLALERLSQAAALSPETIARDPNGKPYFKDCTHRFFGITHTDTVAVAVLGEGKGESVGVDLEFLRSRTDCKKIADRFFGETERQELLRSGESEEVFLRLWTKKEAAAKCSGEGLVPFLGKENPPYHTKSFRIRSDGRIGYLTVCCTARIEECLWINHTKEFFIDEC